MGSHQISTNSQSDVLVVIDEAATWMALIKTCDRDNGERPLLAQQESNSAFPRVKSIQNLVKAAEEEIRRRKISGRFLPRELFGEGAWSMLLDLFVSEYHGRKVSTTSACLAAEIPATTALRWIETLESKGLVRRSSAKMDRRVRYVFLTAEGHQALCSLLRRQLADKN